MEYKASLRYLHMAPRKVRRLAGFVRGKNVGRARAELTALPHRAKRALLALLDSAAANAERDTGAAYDELRVKSLRIDPGPKLKRSMPRAFGRTSPIEKRLSHISMVLETAETRRRPTPPRASAAAPLGAEPPSKITPPHRKLRETSTLTRPRSRMRELGRRVFQRKAI